MKTHEDKCGRITFAIVATALALACPLVISAFTGNAAAQTPLAGQPPNQFAVGAFTAMNGDHFAFADQKLKNGKLAGYVVQHLPTGETRSGSVTCLDVNSANHQARIQWQVEQSTVDPGEIGQTRELDVTDNGDPNGVTPGPDTYTDDGACGGQSLCSNCGSATEGGTLLTIDGNIVVKP
jgi:hypothetical protein